MFRCIRGHTVFVEPLRPGAVVVDLGANRGEFSRQMEAIFDARCYVVESNPILAARLEQDGAYTVWKCAVAGSERSVSFHLANNNEASSILELTERSVHSGGVRETVEVEAKTLETLLAEIGCRCVDLVKMDIEGAEVEVLRTVPTSVLRRIGQITAEFHAHEEFGFDIRQGVEEVIDRISRCGFIVLDFSYGTRRDVLFVNRARHRVARVREMLWRFRTNPPRWLHAGWNAMHASLRNRLRGLLNRATGIDRSS